MNKMSAVKQHSLKIALVSAFALGATALSGGATAATTANATATATVVTPIAVAKSTDLVFGSFYPGATTGTVDVNTNGTRTVTGGVVAATGATATAAKFDVTGQASAAYTVSYASGVTLTGPGTAMALTQISDFSGAGGAATLATAGTLSAGGTQSIYLGGSLAVGANQVAGAYTGTISATVVYN
jgi:hypothetical protein